MANLPIALYFGMKIGQISFFRMSSPVERPYGSKELGSKYQGNHGRRRPSTTATSRRRGGRRRADPSASRDDIDSVEVVCARSWEVNLSAGWA